jgi:hypothetical protein
MCSLQLTLAYVSGTIFEGPTHKLDEEEWCMADALRSDFGTPVDEKKGAVRNKSGKKSVVVMKGIEVPVELCKRHLVQRERMMKCFGTLFAHMSGFAAINAGGTLQHLPVFAGSPLMTILPLFINQGFILGLFAFFKKVRDRLNAEAIAAGRAGKRAQMFDEETIDAENDISCLAGSYLLVQTLRYAQVGKLPNMEGEIEGDTPWDKVYTLYCTGAVLSAASVLIILGRSKVIKTEEDAESYMARFLNIVIGMNGMGFAWCCLFASRTVFSKTKVLDENAIGMETICGRILLSLALSLVCTAAIFALDVVGDYAKARSPPGKNLGGEIITQIVAAKSILVGFSWEHSFDGGVEAIASTTSRPMIIQTILAFLIFAVIVPAWRRHILQKQMILVAYANEQNKADLDYTQLSQKA